MSVSVMNNWAHVTIAILSVPPIQQSVTIKYAQQSPFKFFECIKQIMNKQAFFTVPQETQDRGFKNRTNSYNAL